VVDRDRAPVDYPQAWLIGAHRRQTRAAKQAVDPLGCHVFSSQKFEA
jgi:hypothetical protein